MYFIFANFVSRLVVAKIRSQNVVTRHSLANKVQEYKTTKKFKKPQNCNIVTCKKFLNYGIYINFGV